MTNAQLERLLDTLVESMSAALTREGEASCILATRLVTGTLAAKGVWAAPLAVEVHAMNAIYAEVARTGVTPTGIDTPEGWVVHIGDPKTPGSGWNGHLVAIAKGRYLIDVSIQQVNRPHKQLRIDPFWTIVKPPFLAGRTDAAIVEPTTGSTVVYRARPNDKSFLNAPAWRDFRVHLQGDQVSLRRFRPRATPSKESR